MVAVNPNIFTNKHNLKLRENTFSNAAPDNIYLNMFLIKSYLNKITFEGPEGV